MAAEGAEETKKPSIFRDTAGSIKTLRQFYKDHLKIPDKYTFQGELAGESDRASIILMSSSLEDALAFAIFSGISQRLNYKPNQNDFDRIFRYEGPLGSFSHRLDVAALFGVIEDATYEQLNIIREMRNACAHSKHPMTFGDKALVNVTRRLFEPLGFLPQPSDKPKDIKGAFIVEGTFLFHTLWEGSRAKGEAAIRQQLKQVLEEEERAKGTGPSSHGK